MSDARARDRTPSAPKMGRGASRTAARQVVSQLPRSHIPHSVGVEALLANIDAAREHVAAAHAAPEGAYLPTGGCSSTRGSGAKKATAGQQAAQRHAATAASLDSGAAAMDKLFDSFADQDENMTIVLPRASGHWRDESLEWERVRGRTPGQPPKDPSQYVKGVAVKSAVYEQ